MKKILAILPLAAALIGCCNNKNTSNDMPAYEEGYEQGVSALYGAAYDNTLYIAAGCNFPCLPAADGGSKRYYKGIYKSPIAEPFEWEKAGELPAASAYGVTVQKDNKWYIVGGLNEEKALNSTYRITIKKENLAIDTLAPLPCTVDNAAGCITLDNILYIAGGNADGKASARVFALDLNVDTAKWEELPPMPAPRVQPVCVANGKNICIWGGFCSGDPANAKVYTDGVMLSRDTNSRQTLGATHTDGDTITLSGGCAINIGDGNIYATGGVNKEIFLDAISGSYKLIDRKEYMKQPAEWYRFNNKLLKYNSSGWELIESEKDFARAGALLLNYEEKLIYIGGELKPGIRTPDIYIITTHR